MLNVEMLQLDTVPWPLAAESVCLPKRCGRSAFNRLQKHPTGDSRIGLLYLGPERRMPVRPQLGHYGSRSDQVSGGVIPLATTLYIRLAKTTSRISVFA